MAIFARISKITVDLKNMMSNKINIIYRTTAKGNQCKRKVIIKKIQNTLLGASRTKVCRQEVEGTNTE